MLTDENDILRNSDLITSHSVCFDYAKDSFPLWYCKESGTRECYHLHLHKEPELICVQSGHLIFLVNGEREDLYEGDVLFINPYDPHEGTVAEDCETALYFYLTLDMEKLMALPCAQLQDALSLLQHGKKCYRHRFPDQTAATIGETAEALLEDQINQNQLLLFSDLLRLFYLLGTPDQAPHSNRSEHSEHFSKEIFEFIHNADPAKITLENIAEHFNYNKKYFSRLFHEKLGTSVTDFCLKYKVELAQSLILNGNHNLGEVCFLSGFNYYTYFFRTFKKIAGISPSDYVKSCIRHPAYRENDALAVEESKKEHTVMAIRSRVLSALVKVFETECPLREPENQTLTALKGEHISFQITYCASEKCEALLQISSVLSPYITARTVESIPARMVGYKEHMEIDGNYLRTQPGRFPDCLRAIPKNKLQLKRQKYRTVWFEVSVPPEIPADRYEIKITLTDAAGESLCEDTQFLTVVNAGLPPQKLIHTEWFHADCIADYYKYKVFDEPHWQAIEHFMQTAVQRGQNMIYTPIFTPPLDTAPNEERTTIQLVGVTVRDDGSYAFDFTQFDRWVETALRCGFTHFEISHLATQAGAIAAPKIMATVHNEYKQIFGWDSLLSEPEYPAFLAICLPEITKELERLGIAENTYFHISDEPRFAQIDNYMLAKNAISPYVKGYKIMDALSNVNFFDSGVVQYPVPTTDRVHLFMERDLPERWTYYCCTQGKGCSNRFFSMRLARTRAIGIQLFKFHIDGFLHWGYNFYNTAGSRRHINPYQISDAINEGESGAYAGFPSGDAYLVYPGENGKPEESIRLLALEAGLNDLRAMQALAEKTSYDHVLSLIEDDLDQPITFIEFPTSDFYYIQLRNRVNRELEKLQ